MSRKTQKYPLNNMESGQVNPAFLHSETNGQENGNGTAKPGGPLTSTVVEGLGEEREQWDKPIEFLLSCIAMSVGLGNVWRFPFTAYKNGGGAFLIPYLIVLFFIGKPMYFLEMAIGQFSSYGQVKVWKMVPFFKGLGYASVVGTACVVSYYCSLMAITVYYFIASFQATLPWTVCDETWMNVTCSENKTLVIGSDKSISELYYEKTVFPQYDDVNNGIGAPEWRLTLCLFGSWVCILLSLIKGVQSSGKVAYFTAIFPYFVLFILLIRGVTLPGAWAGIEFFITPQWAELLKPKVWFAAVGQCFFSLSTGFGPIIMFASYNPFRHNVKRDATIISLADTGTSLLAGFTIFSILGSLATELNVGVDDVVKSGPGLAFVSYPEAIGKFDTPVLPQLFAVLFFLMLFTLGLGSATSLTGGIVTVIHDQFPDIPKVWITVAVCIGGFLSGLIYVTPGGQFMLTLVDEFGATLVIYVVATVEIIAIAWFYGLSNICRDIEFMLNVRVGWYWRFCWGFFMPVGLSFVLVYYLATFKAPQHNDTDFPPIAIVCGWILSCSALVFIPICAAHTIWTRKIRILSQDGLDVDSNGYSDTCSAFEKKWRKSFKPTHDWGPRDLKLKEEWSNVPRKTKTFTIIKNKIQALRKRIDQELVES